MAGKKKSAAAEEWISPSGFEPFHERKMSLEFGRASFNITDTQFNVHKIDSHTRSHLHARHQIIYYLKGSGTQYISGQEYEVRPHTVFLVPPNREHNFQPLAGTIAEVFSIRFSVDIASGNRADDQTEDDFHRFTRLIFNNRLLHIKLSATESRKADELMDLLQDELALKRFGYVLAVKGYLLLLIRLFLAATITQDADVEPLSRAQLIYIRATSLIQRTINRPLTLGEVADFCGVSDSYLQKIFRQFLGRSFSRYVQETKVGHAAHLLKTTDLSVKEIAGLCGFDDRNYFTRLFNKIQGSSPRAFRLKK